MHNRLMSLRTLHFSILTSSPWNKDGFHVAMTMAPDLIDDADHHNTVFQKIKVHHGGNVFVLFSSSIRYMNFWVIGTFFQSHDIWSDELLQHKKCTRRQNENGSKGKNGAIGKKEKKKRSEVKIISARPTDKKHDRRKIAKCSLQEKVRACVIA